MKVSQGWSGEVATNRWAKVNVEVDETDLRRILYTAGLRADDIIAGLPTYTAFRLLELEAEFLVICKLIQRYGYPADEGQTKLEQIGADKQTLLTGLRQQHGVATLAPA